MSAAEEVPQLEKSAEACGPMLHREDTLARGESSAPASNRFRLGRGLGKIPFKTARRWLASRKFPRLSGVSGLSILGFVAFESVPWLH